MESTAPPMRLGRVEFTALLAMSMALAALGIDMILPAFGDMRASFGLAEDSTAVAGTVTAYFFGLAIAQVVYGPLADRYGRKPTLYAGYAIYLLGAVASALAPSLSTLLVARFVWGLGAAGPRVVTLSVVRDRFDGNEMSRAMSFIMAVFVLVPIMAPTLGAVVASVASWRWVFGVCGVLVALMALWATRLEESLDPADRLELRFERILAAGRLILTNRLTMGYTLALTSLFGVFVSYLASSEIIFGEVFGVVDEFPILFGALAAVMGAATLANAFVVRRFGTRRMAHGVLLLYVLVAVVFVFVGSTTGGRPELGVFMPTMAAMLSCHSLLIPNFNTIAMEPMRPIAGTASAVIGTVSTAGGALIGALLDQSFDGTILPMAIGFAVLGAVALSLVVWAERGRLFERR
ncbi:MAG TPA: multidrug effflux MFS transporter [Acidimicrobiia bacterium]|nr:multidrug effflux MFS transporter [Acidimicrobiia bacterium]